MQNQFEISVIGAGHAGYEAALASARMGMKTALITFNREKIAEMSCNPSIGGLAKGHLVKEIDALGGEMGRAIDATGIQFRILNKRKGPAVQAPRAQADRDKYREYFIDLLENAENLSLIFEEAVDLLIENSTVKGIVLSSGRIINSKSTIITAGTFLNGLIHIGLERNPAGRLGDPPSNHLSTSLTKAGFKLGRLKTGTPARLDVDSIDFSKTEIQPGDEPPLPFSFSTPFLSLEQVPCWLTYTNNKTHEIINDNLKYSPLYSGLIVGIGPRYCPSIEDKIVKFPDRNRHQIFLEPEGLNSNQIYPNGISTSLPLEAQEKFIRTIPGLEKAKIIVPGYAIEYDFLASGQLKRTLESKLIENLYFAGQVNGTSGYEEAGAQGLIAGINAALKIQQKEPLILNRDQAYIGVLIDDLITYDLDEPYRMFTSRAEYRLLLRCDNADKRLMKIGFELGLISDDLYKKTSKKYGDVEDLIKIFKKTIIKESSLNDSEKEKFFGKRSPGGVSLYHFLKRPEIDINYIFERFPDLIGNNPSTEVKEITELEVKYEGYISLQVRTAQKAGHMEEKEIPASINYKDIAGLSKEAQERLSKIQPFTLGQASRIPGITPAALMALSIYIEKLNNEK